MYSLRPNQSIKIARSVLAVIFFLFIGLASIHKAEASVEHKNHSESCQICHWFKANDFVPKAHFDLKEVEIVSTFVEVLAPETKVFSQVVAGKYRSRAPPSIN